MERASPWCTLCGMQHNVYVLELSDGKFYVGRTSDSESRIQQHFTGYGSAWTRLHAPKRVLEVHCNVPIEMENAITKKYMMQHGWENVRGGAYSQVDLHEEDLADKHKEVLSDADRCLVCGRTGHWASQCYASTRVLVCHRCGQEGHIAPQCGLAAPQSVESAEDSGDSEDSGFSEDSGDSEDYGDSYNNKVHFRSYGGNTHHGRGKPRGALRGGTTRGALRGSTTRGSWRGGRW